MSNFYTFVCYHKQNERDNFYIKIQKPAKLLSIGWGKINPIGIGYQAIYNQIVQAYGGGTSVPDNGAKSLEAFCNFKKGDIIFVRGVAKILDIVTITGDVFYDSTGHAEGDYFLKVLFVSLFANQVTINTSEINPAIYNDVLFEGGRSLVVRKISENNAKEIFRNILG